MLSKQSNQVPLGKEDLLRVSSLPPERELQFKRGGKIFAVEDCQPYPTTGKLARNLDLPMGVLQQQLPIENHRIYSYIVATVKNRGDQFFQLGSGPNFQGDCVTLCTCKHQLRSSLKPEEWPGTWIAGFTRAVEGNGKNYLVYLMRVAQAFPSQQALWNSKALSDKAKHAKDVGQTTYGDLFVPRFDAGDPFHPSSYSKPMSGHSRILKSRWHEDINYRGHGGRVAALLVGDPRQSYLWEHPMITSTEKLYRGGRKDELDSWREMIANGISNF